MGDSVVSICYRIIANSDDEYGLQNVLDNAFLFPPGESAKGIPNSYSDESGNKTMVHTITHYTHYNTQHTITHYTTLYHTIHTIHTITHYNTL